MRLPFRSGAALSILIAAGVAGAAAWIWIVSERAGRAPCPLALSEADRLVLVTTPTMDGPSATLETFERASPSGPWRRRSGPEPAVVGQAGLGWGFTFRDKAVPGEPLKMEGDQRSPAGIFAIGKSFGFAATDRPDYVQLKPGVQICVDDPASLYYSQIVTRAEAGPEAKGEDMPAIPVYARGLAIDYKTSGAERAGSCIFMHIWKGEGAGTAGCVAAPESSIASLQDFAGKGRAAIAILAEGGKRRFPGCLPGP